jgi:ParB family transcriptional regulator, chromosome partitioning protein
MAPPQELRNLPVDLVEPNLSQPRQYFDEAALDALAGSIGERGVLQPVLVRSRDDGKYELIAGERRWRAAKIAGLQSIPSLISPYDDLAALETALIENMAREDLNPVEEARACTTLVSELGLTYRQLGARLGRSKSGVANLVRLLDLSEGIIELMEGGELSRSHGEALLLAQNPQVRGALARMAVEQGWSTRTLQARARESNNSSSSASPSHSSGHSSASPDNPVQEDGSDDVAMNIARVWGDALGTEVQVRTLPHHKLRVELLFDTPEGALALGKRITQALTQHPKRK